MNLLTLAAIIGIIAGITTVLVALAKLVKWLWEYRSRKPQPPVVEEKKEPTRPIPQPPRRREPRFIDRHDREGRDLVERVSEALGGNGLVTVWGSGGVGKTTLAIEVAHRLCPSPYSGGVIWDTADGRADFALITLLDKILTDLEREEARTLTPDAKADLVDRLLTEAMPCLLGLDNFETIAEEEQRAIIAFLNELSCPVLVTSRRRLPIGQNIHVGPMRPDEAEQFLTYLVKQSPKRERLGKVDLDRLAYEAGYNPMLMRWMIRQLAHEVPAEDVYAGLDRGEGDAERVFKRSFDLLGDDGQMALLALALFVPTASREALAAVCGFADSKDRVNEAIRTLAAFDLLDTAVEGDRLGIVALTRRLTEAQLKRDERTEGLKQRFIAYFLAYAEAHTQVTKEDLDALDEKRENLLAALDYAYGANDWQSVMAILEAIAFPGLLYTRGYWDDALAWGERGLEAARKAHDDATIARFAHNLANIYVGRGKYAEAKDLYNHSLEIERKLGDQVGVAASLHQLGIIAQHQGHYQQALDFYSRSLEIKQQLGDQAGIAKALHQLGMISQIQGQYQRAKNLHNRSLEIKRILGDQAGIAKSLHQLGMIAQNHGHYEQALDFYSRSLEIEQQLGDQAGIAKSLHQLGMIAQDQGNYQEAKDLYNQSLEINRNLGDQVGIASSLFQLGRVAEDAGKSDEAIRLFKESLAMAEELGVPQAEMVREALARVSKDKE